jgi:hypothetical protein
MDGTVLVSVVDAKTDKVMWQGQAADVVDLPVARPERAEAQIGHAVAEIFKKFPPQTTAVLTQAVRHGVDTACAIAHQAPAARYRAGRRSRSSQSFPRHWWERTVNAHLAGTASCARLPDDQLAQHDGMQLAERVRIRSERSGLFSVRHRSRPSAGSLVRGKRSQNAHSALGRVRECMSDKRVVARLPQPELKDRTSTYRDVDRLNSNQWVGL